MEFSEFDDVEFDSAQKDKTVRGTIQHFSEPETMAWVRCVDEDYEFSHHEWVEIENLRKL